MAVWPVRGECDGFGRRVVPSRPDSPWISDAVAKALENGLLAPGYTGTLLARLTAVRMERVLEVV
jgi:hypothetical protein